VADRGRDVVAVGPGDVLVEMDVRSRERSEERAALDGLHVRVERVRDRAVGRALARVVEVDRVDPDLLRAGDRDAAVAEVDLARHVVELTLAVQYRRAHTHETVRAV